MVWSFNFFWRQRKVKRAIKDQAASRAVSLIRMRIASCKRAFARRTLHNKIRKGILKDWEGFAEKEVFKFLAGVSLV
jgi:hypothetical protein